MSSLSLRHVFCVLGCLSAALSAQTPATTSTSESTDAPGPNARRSYSREAAAALAGIKFEAPESEKKKEQEVPDDVDLRDIDKPRNAIIRLPKYIVEGERPPVFTEKEINTRKGLADLAVKRYLSSVQQGLNNTHLPAILGGLSNEDIAMQMYREDQRVKAQADYNEKLSLFRAAGAKEADQMKKEADAALKQQGTFSTPGRGGPQQGNSPRIMRDGDW